MNGNAVTGWSAVALAWGVAGAVLVTYVVSILRRGRALARRVPEEEQRWM